MGNNAIKGDIFVRTQTCCFTGHRHIPEKNYAEIREKLEQTIIKLYNNGIINYRAGGALGFDTLAAETVLRLRETYSELRLILVLSCKDQTRGWKAKDVDKYEKIRQRADETVYTSEIYATGCMHKRNRHLVDCSSVCVCYQTQPRGGTAYTVNYARAHGLAIFNMA